MRAFLFGKHLVCCSADVTLHTNDVESWLLEALELIHAQTCHVAVNNALRPQVNKELLLNYANAVARGQFIFKKSQG